MPPACTRNRAILYGVPWLAALGAVGAALVLPPATVDSLAVWTLAGSVLFFGLPHGAADWWVMQVAAGPRWHAGKTRALLATLYVLAALATLLFWFWQPGVALAGFFALTVWHFGSADASVLLPDKTPWRDPVWWLFGVGRGLLVIFTSLTFWPAQAARVLIPFVALGHGTGLVIADLLGTARYFLWTGAALQTVGLCVEIRLQSTPPRPAHASLRGTGNGRAAAVVPDGPAAAVVCVLLGGVPRLAAPPADRMDPTPGTSAPALARRGRFPSAHPSANAPFPARTGRDFHHLAGFATRPRANDRRLFDPAFRTDGAARHRHRLAGLEGGRRQAAGGTRKRVLKTTLVPFYFAYLPSACRLSPFVFPHDLSRFFPWPARRRPTRPHDRPRRPTHGL